MFSPQVTSSVRRSLCSYLAAHRTNPLCRTCMKNVYSVTFYCSHTKQSKQSVRLNNYFSESKNDNEEELKINDLKPLKDYKHNKIIGNEKLLTNPVGNLHSVYQIVNRKFNNKTCINFEYELNVKKYSMPNVKCKITISWPEEMSFAYVASNKKTATKHAALACLNWLLVNKKINKSFRPALFEGQEIRNLLNKPINIDLNSEFQNNIRELIHEYNNEIQSVIERTVTVSTTDSNKGIPDERETEFSNTVSEEYIENRNADLLQKLEQRKSRKNDLPIFKYKKEILDSLEKNQVLLIKGDTGCGKSTQVPQFIIDAFTQNGKANECNILMAEPRRISAISLAERIAKERVEFVGSVVGYHVRLQKMIPGKHGSILICTTGILLKLIRANPTLKDVSHVIIDEAHERSMQIDILLNLLKRILVINPSLKVVIMSATVNADLFQQYLSCAVIDVPGKLFPVKTHFIDDMNLFKSNSSLRHKVTPQVCFEEVEQLINWIDKTKPPGAILCFLPGWKEIKRLQNMLDLSTGSNYYTLTLHSKMSNNDQQKVFEPAPTNTRKVILATDIAESSITIADVRYVVDTAVKKEMRWNDEKNVNQILTTWVSQANICQRKGRAGRTQPGNSYHFITKEAYNQLSIYPEPEISKISLEQSIILVKTYCDEKVNDFFSNMLTKPNEMSANIAVLSLTSLGILDENENLTPLGKRLTHLTLDPRLSKAVLYSCVFQCLTPMLSIAIMCSANNDLAANSITGKSMIRRQKYHYHATSDHIALFKYFRQYGFNNPTVRTLEEIFALHVTELINCGMLTSSLDSQDANTYSENNELVRAILFSISNRLIKHSDYGFKNGYFTKSANMLTDEKGEKAIIKPESVNHKRKTWASDYLMYVNQMEYVDFQTTMISETSMISPLSVLLFSKGNVICKTKKDSDILITIDNLANVKLSCDKETAELLLEFRSILWNVVDYIILHQNKTKSEDFEIVKYYRDELLCILSKMLYESSKRIDCSENIDESLSPGRIKENVNEYS